MSVIWVVVRIKVKFVQCDYAVAQTAENIEENIENYLVTSIFRYTVGIIELAWRHRVSPYFLSDNRVLPKTANKMDWGWTTLNLDVSSNLRSKP